MYIYISMYVLIYIYIYIYIEACRAGSRPPPKFGMNKAA